MVEVGVGGGDGEEEDDCEDDVVDDLYVGFLDYFVVFGEIEECGDD